MRRSFAGSLAHAARALVRRPVFSLLDLTLLTLATTAVAAIFAIVSATLLRPLPFRDPDALVAVVTTEPAGGDSLTDFVSAPIELARWRSDAKSFTSVEGYTPVTLGLSGDGEPQALRGHAISAGLFDLLGTPPRAGRSFRRDEETPESGVVILGSSVAKRRFGGDEAAIGKQVVVDGAPRTVVGVMPPGYSLLYQGGDIWVPLDLTLKQQTTRARLRIIAPYARLRPGVTRARASAEVAAIQRQLREEFPDAFPYTKTRLDPLRDNLFGPNRARMYVLLGALSLILLIAAANVGNLTIADVVARRTMTMTRLAFGASRSSIVKLRLAETTVLVVAATLVGLIAATGVLAIFNAVDSAPLVALGGRWIDWRVIAAVVVGAVLVGFGATLPAALAEASLDIGTLASAGAKSAGGRTDKRVRHWLATVQVAVTVVLLCGAALLSRDLMRLLAERPGFDPPGLLAVMFNISANDHPTETSRAQYVNALVNAVKAVPGVEGASTIQSRFILNESMQASFDVEGRAPAEGIQQNAQIRHVMPDVFKVMRIRVLQGRGIDSTDRADGRPVAVVSNSFARTYWPGESAIGKRIRRSGRATNPWMDIVGVVDDIMDAGAGVPLGAAFYVSYLQQNTPTARVTLVVRARGDAAAHGRAIRRAIWMVSPTQAIDDVSSLVVLLRRSASQQRFQALVITAFGVSAIVLVLAGVYALTLFSVLGRRRELGVRAALGAEPVEIVRVTLQASLAPVVSGVVVGIVAAWPLMRLMQRSLGSRVDAADGAVVALVAVLLLATAGCAAFLPARRASRESPAVALRG